MHVLLPLLLLLPLPQARPNDRLTLVEGFDLTNEGGWSFFGNPANPIEVLEPTGGRPDGWLHSTCSGLGCLDTFAPQLRTTPGVSSIFTGDYRGRGVDALGVDLVVLDVDFSSTGRPLTLLLRSDSGTPASPGDDVVVAFVGPRSVPAPNGHWRRFDFRVPSARTTLPPGWRVSQGTGNDDADWSQVMGDVDQVTFFFGDPDFFFIFQQWELGVDNVRIRLAPR